MASTRRIRIFEDPSTHLQSQHDPVDLSRAHEIVLDPSLSATDGRSPLKPRQPRSLPPKALFGKLKPIDLPRPHCTPLLTDSLNKQDRTVHSQPLPTSDTAVFGSLPTYSHLDQENQHDTPSDNYGELPHLANSCTSPGLDQASADPVSLPAWNSESIQLKASVQSNVPEPHDLPQLKDNYGDPKYTYATLIGMAILRAPNRRLTLAQIYKWISETFSYYPIWKTGWQNSIRHNLSINKAFVKQERSKDDPGKGNYWTIKPGMESQFLGGKPSRRPPSAGGPPLKTFSQPQTGQSSHTSSLPVDTAPSPVPPLSAVQDQPSSDGTIPASDTFLQEEIQAEVINMPPPVSRPLFSSPSPVIGSSPPLVPHTGFGEGSPLQALEVSLPPVQTRSGKRSAAAMDDSGYFSSLESSVPRRCGSVRQSTDLEADRPRLKRGRAEEEIARIRSSSHDLSPSKVRSSLNPPASQLASSSPAADLEKSLMLPPLTPSITFKIAPNPPASISPNTNLRNHRNRIRELVGSPVRNLGTLHDEAPFSPIFDLPDDDRSGSNNGFHSSFDIYIDPDEVSFPSPLSASAGRRYARFSRPMRPGKTNSTLADVTDTYLNCRPPNQAPRLEDLGHLLHRNQAKESYLSHAVHTKVLEEDLFRLVADNDAEHEDLDDLDILQGFQKIGRSQDLPSKARKAKRLLLDTKHLP
ncbi:MAG: hypothetical protein Q9222_000902 [Ikaeria aurantiellina]